MPALAKLIAMPPPMVPKPITAARSMRRVGVSSGRPAILAAVRSAKKAWRRAFDCSEATSSRNIARSIFTPSSNGRRTAASTASTHLTGETWPRAWRATRARACSKNASGSMPAGSSARAARSRGCVRLPTSSPAKSSTPRKLSAATMRSISPLPSAASAPIGSPETIICSASSAPTARGSRWVPPAPGSRPILTSGSPIAAFGVATR